MTALPSRRTRPPFDCPRIDKTNPLTRGMRALFVGDNGYELVNGLLFNRLGTPTVGSDTAGRLLRCAANGVSYDGYYPPETTAGSRSDTLYNPIAPPITLVCIGRATGNFSCGIQRANGSGNGSWGCGMYTGTNKGAYGFFRTSSYTLLSPPDALVESIATPGVGIFSIGAANYALWSAPLGASTLYQETTGATPSGNFYYEYADAYRCMSYGSSFVVAGGDISLGALFVGVAWSKEQAREFLTNPWQLFEE